MVLIKNQTRNYSLSSFFRCFFCSFTDSLFNAVHGIFQTKKYLDSVVGKEESARIFQANDNKKIGKFWKVGPDDKDDDD